MGRRLGVGTKRTSWFMPPNRKSLGRAVTLIERPLGPLKHSAQFLFTLSLFLLLFAAMLQADDEDDMMEMQMKSPFGSSFRTFNATDYKPIGMAFVYLLSFMMFKGLSFFPLHNANDCNIFYAIYQNIFRY